MYSPRGNRLHYFAWPTFISERGIGIADNHNNYNNDNNNHNNSNNNNNNNDDDDDDDDDDDYALLLGAATQVPSRPATPRLCNSGRPVPRH